MFVFEIIQYAFPNTEQSRLSSPAWLKSVSLLADYLCCL